MPRMSIETKQPAQQQKQTPATEQSTLKAAETLAQRTQDFSLEASKSRGMHIFYDPADFLQGYIEKVIGEISMSMQEAHIKVLGHNIIISPNLIHVYTDLPAGKLRMISLLNYHKDELSIETSYGEIGSHKLTGCKQELLESFIWRLAMFTARGRVPIGTEVDRPVILRHWPNLARLYRSQYCMRIASLWIRKPIIMSEFAMDLRVPREHIFNFYSAAHAIGLIETNIPANVISFNPAPKQKDKGLFASILRRLKSSK